MQHNQKDFDCSSCKWGHHCDESNPAPNSSLFEIQGVMTSAICFKPMATPTTLHAIKLNAHYSNGFLYDDGGVGSQPNKYMDEQALISSYISNNLRS